MFVVKSNKPKWGYPNLMDQYLSRELASVFGADAQTTVPNVNITEDETSYGIEVAAPGLKKEDFKIQLEKETLVISAELKKETEEKAPKFLKKEFSYSGFKRSFHLPENVSQQSITASYENGVLKLTLPKEVKKPEEGAKTISIS